MLLVGTGAARKRQGKHAFEAIDPSQQRVYCTWEAWDARIVPGHPEVADLQDEIRSAIAHPLRRRVRRQGSREWRSYFGAGPTAPLLEGSALEVVCVPQGQVVAVGLTGPTAGLTAAVEQIEAGALDSEAWMVTYDADADIVRLRTPDAGPAITYESPAQPEFLVRLDIRTGLLTGIDLMGARASFEDHSQRLHRMGTALSALGGKRRDQAVDPADLVSNFIALSPLRLRVSHNGVARAG